MNPQPYIPNGAFLRLVQNNIDEIPLEDGVDTHFRPQVQDGPCTFPADTFSPGDSSVFIAPKAGFYEFNRSVEIIGGGQLYAFLKTESQKITGLTEGAFSGLVATVRAKVYLAAGALVQFGVRYQGGDEASVQLRPDSNFLEITYVGP